MALTKIASYPELRKKVRETLVLAQKKIEDERVRTYWETGRLIDSHTLFHKEKGAFYGRQVIIRLSHDLGIEKSVLNRTHQFYCRFPNIADGQYLPWSHYRFLIPIKDDRKRRDLARRSKKEKWSHQRLAAEAQRFYEKPPQDSQALVLGKSGGLLRRPVLGPFYHYRIVEETNFREPDAKRYVDLGFGTHLPVGGFGLRAVTLGDIVRVSRDEQKAYRFKQVTDVGKKELFTYRADVIRVIDGDTLWMHIDLGLGILKKVKIRLRAIDTPPITKPRGKRAKAFLEGLVRPAPYLTLKSWRAGKFDRYLGDLFAGNDIYVNQKLVDAGLARVV